jgi:hypothetical protein
MLAPPPRSNPILLGHEPAEATLLAALASARMHHAWLISAIGEMHPCYREPL